MSNHQLEGLPSKTQNTEKDCGCHHDDDSEQIEEGFSKKQLYFTITSFVLLVVAIILELVFKIPKLYLLPIFLISYLLVGFDVLKKAFQSGLKGDLFNENFLMSIATIAAFSIGSYDEAVAVMLFYSIGELFQDWAVNKSKSSIKALLDIRPNEATVLRNNQLLVVDPTSVEIGEIIEIKNSQKVPLDGILISQSSNFNTVALTGESKPRTVRIQEEVMAGMVNLGQVIQVKVTNTFEDSSFAKILDLVQNASKSKAKTQLFISKFARIYTPIVVFLAFLVLFVPALFVTPYVFSDWLYRAIIFLIISCPCGLVISIPLGYFGGIGASAKNGILLKGSNYLDVLTDIDTVVFDKTGTLTEGVFAVKEVNLNKSDLALLATLESKSTHPIARAVCDYVRDQNINYNSNNITNVAEEAGNGLVGKVNNQTIIVGNDAILHKFDIEHPDIVHEITETVVFMVIDNEYKGYLTIADKIKPETKEALSELRALGVKNLVMLSGDKDIVTQKIASEIGITIAYGDLLPQDKATKVQEIKDRGAKLAFVGDGINDAPVLALADVGVAMGAKGSDIAIETSNVVLQTDNPLKLATAIKIARFTRNVVYQNIILAMSIKLIVLVLGTFGLANLWEAVFADVGVALLAILNANRTVNKKFDG